MRASVVLRIVASAVLAIGCYAAAGLSWNFSAALGVVCFGVLSVMALLNDPAFQAKIEARIDPPSRSQRSEDSASRPSPPRALR